jgi:hypothetical protein
MTRLRRTSVVALCHTTATFPAVSATRNGRTCSTAYGCRTALRERRFWSGGRRRSGLWLTATATAAATVTAAAAATVTAAAAAAAAVTFGCRCRSIGRRIRATPTPKLRHDAVVVRRDLAEDVSAATSRVVAAVDADDLTVFRHHGTTAISRTKLVCPGTEVVIKLPLVTVTA